MAARVRSSADLLEASHVAVLAQAFARARADAALAALLPAAAAVPLPSDAAVAVLQSYPDPPPAGLWAAVPPDRKKRT